MLMYEENGENNNNNNIVNSSSRRGLTMTMNRRRYVDDVDLHLRIIIYTYI